MDLDEIQSVQSRERQTDSLQQLRDSFYEEAGEFVRSLRAERERAAEAADDPFDSPKVARLSDDIDTAEQTLQAIYERRVGKVVKMASLAAADMPTEEEGLTTEERDLFDDLVKSIESNRERVFDVLDGNSMAVAGNADTASPVEDRESRASSDESPGMPEEGVATPVDEPKSAGVDSEPTVPPAEPDAGTPSPDAEAVPAADLMGSDSTAEERPAGSDPSATSSTTETGKAPATGSTDKRAEPATRRDGGPPDSSPESKDATSTTADGVERRTVRITSDVGEILGVDDRTYDLITDDIVTLPETNAEPLLERGVAETLQ